MAERSVPDKPVILCVDDEETPLLLRKLALQKAGYEVHTARTGEQAINLLASSKTQIDLILSDYLMPTMNGLQLAKEIKSRYPNLPILLLSGVNEMPTDVSSVDGFLSKVMGPDAMCQQIAAALNKTDS